MGRPEHVQAVVWSTLADEPGTEDLTLTIVPLSRKWTVNAAGLGCLDTS